MNYQEIYDALIAHAKEMGKPSGYAERHHVIPVCFFKKPSRKRNNRLINSYGDYEGNPDAPENLVWLTAQDHFIAHELLMLIYKDDPVKAYPMLAAYKFMQENQKGEMVYTTPELYAQVKKEFATAQSARKKEYFKNPEHREAMARSMRIIKADPVYRAKQSAIKKAWAQANPDILKAIHKKAEAWRKTPEGQLALQRAQSERWGRTQEREKQSERTRNHFANNPEYVIAHGKRMSERATPEWRQAMSETKKQVLANNPHLKEVVCRSLQAIRENPILRAKHLKAQKEATCKPVTVILNNGDTLDFESVSAACKALNVNRGDFAAKARGANIRIGDINKIICAPVKKKAWPGAKVYITPFGEFQTLEDASIATGKSRGFISHACNGWHRTRNGKTVWHPPKEGWGFYKRAKP